MSDEYKSKPDFILIKGNNSCQTQQFRYDVGDEEIHSLSNCGVCFKILSPESIAKSQMGLETNEKHTSR